MVDITYLTMAQGFVYLALLTDASFRFFVGYDLSTSLTVEGCLRALSHALSDHASLDLTGLIHHSDHGVQYTAGPYPDLLGQRGLLSSMGQVGNCYDNPLAERMNAILKDEYHLDQLFVSVDQALSAIHLAIRLYNFERPHSSLDLCKPAHLHLHPQGH